MSDLATRVTEAELDAAARDLIGVLTPIAVREETRVRRGRDTESSAGRRIRETIGMGKTVRRCRRCGLWRDSGHLCPRRAS